jgi:polyhydroxyalkanoate synthesis regulator phasin
MSKRTIIASAGAAVALAAGAGGAYAAGGFGGGSGPGDPGGPAIAVHVDFGGPPGPPGDVEVGVAIPSPAVASYLGLSESELRTQLEAGKTLAQIANAQGKSVSGLKDAIYAEARSNLDQAVTDGKLTASQEQTMLADLKSHLDDIVNRTGPPGGVKAGVEVFGTAVASYLGLSETELRTQLEAGKTLAQIANAQGKSVSGLKDAIYAEARSNLDQAVADGKLTATDEQTMLADLKSHLDEIVNNSGPLRVEGQSGAFRILATDVAAYLGLSEDQLRTQVESGKSLAQIATAQGKSVEGLKAAIVADAKSKLDQAVAAGKITAAQAKAMLDELTSHVDDLVNRAGPPHLQQARAA